MRTATIGKILGALGLILLLSSPLTYFITTGQGWIAAMKAGVGVLFIGAFFATNLGKIGQFASGRSTFFFATSALTALVALGGLAAVNYIAVKKNKIWDLTSKKIYTLAPQTLSALKGLKEPVKAIGFLDSSHPYHETVENLLERYHREAPEKFDYSFKDPRKHPDLASKYQLTEGQTTIVLARGEGEQASHTSLNLMSVVTREGEQELTNALLKLNAVGEQKVYFVAGHHELPLDPIPGASGDEGGASLSEFKRQLTQEGYAPEALNLMGKEEVPKDAALVVIAGARGVLREPEVKAMRRYLDEGGRLLYFAEANTDTGPEMSKLLSDHGVELDPGIVADERFFVSSPYAVISLFYTEHEVTRLLQQMQVNVELPTARGLSVVHEGTLEGVKAEPLVLTSPYAWEESTPDERPAPSSGEKAGQIPLLVVSTRPTASAPGKRFDEARVAVFGDADLLVDANWGHEGNRNLVLNALAWTSNQVNKITIRPPDRDISTLDIDEGTMSKVSFLAMDLLPLSLLGVGLAIWLTRRNK